MSPMDQCRAAHVEDRRECVGAFDAVTVIDAADVETSACVLHGAVLLASLADGRVRGGSEPAAAIAVYYFAEELKPFDWRGDAARGRAVEFRSRHVRIRDGKILCAHANLDGEGAHWLEPGEKCQVSHAETSEQQHGQDDEMNDAETCPNCGAPTGGDPCTWRGGSSLSCHDVITLDNAYDTHDWDTAKTLIAEIREFAPELADDLWRSYLTEYSDAENAKRGVAAAQARVDAKRARREGGTS